MLCLLLESLHESILYYLGEVPRFFLWRAGQILAVYLAYVQLLQANLAVQVISSGRGDYIWANKQGRWETNWLTQIISRESQKKFGVRLTTHDSLHVAIRIGREVTGEHFARGYSISKRR